MKIVIVSKSDFIKLVNSFSKALVVEEFLSFIIDVEKSSDKHYLLEEIAEILDLSRGEILNAYNKNQLKGYIEDGRLYFLASDIVNFKTKKYKVRLEKAISQIEQETSVLTDSAKIYNLFKP